MYFFGFDIVLTYPGIQLDFRYPLPISPPLVHKSVKSRLWWNPNSQHRDYFSNLFTSLCTATVQPALTCRPSGAPPSPLLSRLTEESFVLIETPVSLAANNEIFDHISIIITFQNHIQRQIQIPSWRLNSLLHLRHQRIPWHRKPLHHPTLYLDYEISTTDPLEPHMRSFKVFQKVR